MIPQLTQALSEGISADQIIDYIIKKFPSHAKKIKSAIASGFSADQILQYLSGGRASLTRSDANRFSTTEYEAMRGKDIAGQQQRQKTALSGVALAAGSLAAPMASAALQRALPTNLAPMIQGLLPGQIKQEAQNLVQPQQPPMVSPSNISQNADNLPTQGISTNLSDILFKHTSKDQIDALIKSGNGPEEVSAFLKKFKAKDVKAIEKEAGQPIEKVVEEYLKANPQQTAPKAEAEAKPIVKGSTVATPAGVGEVKEIRNGKALIEVDGKKHAIDEDELIEPPIPEKDLADLYDDLIAGIEKQTGKQVSRNVEWAGYDPNSNELAYKPHGSDKLYAYADISPEDVELLTSLLTQRKSTGQNFIGAWEAGTESPIGAAMYQLIKKLQTERGGKGNEYKNRYETIYDAIEPAKAAAKKRHAERKKKAKKPRVD